MPQRKRSCTHKSTPKLFRCTGFGNCNMVFTRSEHLARHERKHTGEKPYKCIVPSCGRMFSRFDNMMQHTQTHDKNKKKERRASETSEFNEVAFDSSNGSHQSNEWQNHQQRKTAPEVAMATLSEHSMLHNRILPPLRRGTYPDSLVGYPNYPTNYPYSLPQSPNEKYSHAPPTMYRPYQPCDSPCSNTPGNRYSWPTFRGPREFPSTEEISNNCPPSFGYRRRSSTSTASTDTSVVTSNSQNPSDYHSSIPSNNVHIRRRISIDDLRTPIEDIQSIQFDQKNNPKQCNYADKQAVDITSDEYEALEGLSKFHSKNTISDDDDDDAEDIPTSVAQENTTFASQVCALRQRVMSLKESFQRPVRNIGNDSL